LRKVERLIATYSREWADGAADEGRQSCLCFWISAVARPSSTTAGATHRHHRKVPAMRLLVYGFVLGVVVCFGAARWHDNGLFDGDRPIVNWDVLGAATQTQFAAVGTWFDNLTHRPATALAQQPG